MLFTINKGNTGRNPGCQTEIVHLVSTVELALQNANDWAFSNGNAGARYTDFFQNTAALETELDWNIIRSNDWGGTRIHKKAAEFLVADFFPWENINMIGCYNEITMNRVKALIKNQNNIPET